jgi:hypothetical protein
MEIGYFEPVYDDRDDPLVALIGFNEITTNFRVADSTKLKVTLARESIAGAVTVHLHSGARKLLPPWPHGPRETDF